MGARTESVRAHNRATASMAMTAVAMRSMAMTGATTMTCTRMASR
jgi:hypothetical protein